MTKIAPSQPAPAPPKGFRPHMPIKVKLQAALHAIGMTLEDTDFDHCPPLQLRVFDPVAGDTIPPANDAVYIVPRPREAHRAKTMGIQTKAKAAGDVTEIAKTKRLAGEQEQFRSRLLAKEPRGDVEKPKGKWASRPFQTRKKGTLK